MSKSGKRKKKYNPQLHLNKVVLDKKIEKLKNKADENKKQLDLWYNAHERHIEYLANFTSHDIKNAIQNMDSVVSSLEFKNIKQEDIDTIKTCLNNIRQSLDNFTNLVPNSNKKEFHLSELCKSAELINRAVFKKKRITFGISFEKTDNILINQPFHNLLQVLNNLLLNSIKAIETVQEHKEIKIICRYDEIYAYIYICDSGSGIVEENKEKIFDIYFTTTNGSGIGLYHAKYIIERINGFIKLDDNPQNFGNFTTVFELIIPIKDDKVSIDN